MRRNSRQRYTMHSRHSWNWNATRQAPRQHDSGTILIWSFASENTIIPKTTMVITRIAGRVSWTKFALSQPAGPVCSSRSKLAWIPPTTEATLGFRPHAAVAHRLADFRKFLRGRPAHKVFFRLSGDTLLASPLANARLGSRLARVADRLTGVRVLLGGTPVRKP